MGERLARQLLKLQPVSTSPYVLLSNLYASDDIWDGVTEARKMLKVSGLKKEPGHSLIEGKFPASSSEQVQNNVLSSDRVVFSNKYILFGEGNVIRVFYEVVWCCCGASGNGIP
ncbi:Pentatricopeptide repeat superfamily protein [Tripterygium wilfordii]|uniref:Pentatricopeptide repeat superfamily protein n=1 Tax=Tripterygium wilfordii TaxID=458696 RepID=A0A7J7CH07_TRIWF|nr:Pentatricopeptide repeat superfamily protein [Tripterygium wilfordii]